MAQFKGRYWLVFEQDKAKQPLICQMGRKFDVVFNIRHASVADGVGVIAIEIEGERPTVKDAVTWLESLGVQVDPVELQTIEG